MKTPARIAGLGGILVVLALSCTPDRPAPGSDLPSLSSDASADASYPPMQPGSVVSGLYVADTVLRTADGVVDAKLNIIFSITQTGVIADGNATLSGSVWIDQLESKTKKDFTGVPVSAAGVFEISVNDMFIPKEVNSLLLEDVTQSKITWKDAHVITSCEFRGQMEANLLNVNSLAGQLESVLVFGPFVASGGACSDAGVPEAGADAEQDALEEAAADAEPDALEEAAADAEPDAGLDGPADGPEDAAADSVDDVADAQEGS